jgi:phage-related protein (TIGR01555 family)
MAKGSRKYDSVPKAEKPATGASLMRHDSWQNLLTGIGDAQRDKRMQSTNVRNILSYPELVDLYRSDDLAAKIVDRPVEEMLRQGFEVKIAGDKEAAEATNDALKALGTQEILADALRWSRAYGGAGILMGADDSRDMSKPLNMNAIKKISFLTAFQSIELQGISFYSNPVAPKFGQTDKFRVVPQLAGASSTWNTEVHESRILQFRGTIATRRQVTENYGWGDSVLQRVWDVIRDFQMSWAGTASILQDFAQGVFKMKGLADAVVADDGSRRVLNRLAAMDMARSMIRAVILDADGEDFERKQTPIAGLSDTLQQLAIRLAAAADMPVTLLMGQSPSGMNATGEADISNWYDRVKGMQTGKVQPALEQLVLALFLSKEGPTKGKEPDQWSIHFHPLQQETKAEKSAARLANAQADQIYFAMGAVSAQEIADSRFGGDEYGEEIVLDTELRDSMEDALDRASQNNLGEPDPVEAAATEGQAEGVKITATQEHSPKPTDEDTAEQNSTDGKPPKKPTAS